MADDRDDVSRRGEGPAYRVHRAGDAPPHEPTDDAPYTRYRSKPRGLRERLSGEEAGLDELRGDGGDGGRRDRAPRSPRHRRRLPSLRSRDGRITPRRVLLWIALAIGAWLALSLVLFLLSAQIEQGKVSDEAKAALRSAGPMPFSTNTILILGSDARPEDSKEPGANPGGPSRSDTIMLWRVGGGHASRLSIPRDTVVDIPGHGRQKINAAYAFGGAALSIQT